MIRKILVEETIACPQSRLWLILTLPAEVRKWIGAAECSFEPRLGGEVRLRGTSASTRGEIVQWSPPTLFALQFTPGARVEFWCDPGEGKTRLVISSTVGVSDTDALAATLTTWSECLERIKLRAESR